jgi:hypothetical protein
MARSPARRSSTRARCSSTRSRPWGRRGRGTWRCCSATAARPRRRRQAGPGGRSGDRRALPAVHRGLDAAAQHALGALLLDRTPPCGRAGPHRRRRGGRRRHHRGRDLPGLSASGSPSQGRLVGAPHARPEGAGEHVATRRRHRERPRDRDRRALPPHRVEDGGVHPLGLQPGARRARREMAERLRGEDPGQQGTEAEEEVPPQQCVPGDTPFWGGTQRMGINLWAAVRPPAYGWVIAWSTTAWPGSRGRGRVP